MSQLDTALNLLATEAWQQIEPNHKVEGGTRSQSTTLHTPQSRQGGNVSRQRQRSPTSTQSCVFLIQKIESIPVPFHPDLNLKSANLQQKLRCMNRVPPASSLRLPPPSLTHSLTHLHSLWFTQFTVFHCRLSTQRFTWLASVTVSRCVTHDVTPVRSCPDRHSQCFSNDAHSRLRGRARACWYGLAGENHNRDPPSSELMGDAAELIVEQNCGMQQ